jgi:hypothetical protein
MFGMRFAVQGYELRLEQRRTVKELHSNRLSGIAKSILEYLKQHPASADTKEGIARWWVMEQHLQEQVLLVETELDYLVDKGLIDHSVLAGRTIYRAKTTVHNADDK